MSDDFNLGKVELEVTFQTVDPELLAILTGRPATPSFAIEVHSPIKRTFWQWLRRKPRRYDSTYIPNATLAADPANGDAS